MLKKGYLELERNFTQKGGEIDLILKSPDGFIVFVEVKSQRSDSDFSIYSSLSHQKKVSLKRTINKWLLSKGKLLKPWRVDFVGIIYKKPLVIEHFEFVDLN